MRKGIRKLALVAGAAAMAITATPSFAATAQDEERTLELNRAENVSKDAAPGTGETVAQPATAKQSVTKTEVQKEAVKNGRPRLALTLAGGGSRGAAHIGVLKVLDREGIKPDFISGNSIGAIIGALYAAGVPIDEIERLALNGKLKKAFFPIPKNIQSVLYTGPYYLQRALLLKPKIGLYSGRSISKFIDKNLPEGIENFEDLKIPMAVTAINLVDTKPVWLSKGKISTAVRASATVPLMYRPIGPKNGPQLVDGGLRANLPTEIPAAIGAPLVVAVKLHSYLEAIPRKEFDTTTDLADRVTSIFMAEVEDKGVSGADILIEPEVQYMTMHSFDKESMAKGIAAGELAAKKQVDEIKRRLAATGVAHSVKSEGNL